MCVICGCESNVKDVHYHEHNQDEHYHKHEISLNKAILAKNNHFAELNRNFFNQCRSLALNLVSSPGSGKTTLLEKTIYAMAGNYPIYVIEGDQQTDLDAQRVREAGAQAYQVNTGKACHLDGHMVSHATKHLKIRPESLTFIENVGNLICPALFDLGEHIKVVLFSITEGEDKPLKYPDMFVSADLILITKLDLLPHLIFDIEQCVANIYKINSGCKIIKLSAISGTGFNKWLNWLTQAKNYFTLR